MNATLLNRRLNKSYERATVEGDPAWRLDRGLFVVREEENFFSLVEVVAGRTIGKDGGDAFIMHHILLGRDRFIERERAREIRLSKPFAQR